MSSHFAKSFLGKSLVAVLGLIGLTASQAQADHRTVRAGAQQHREIYLHDARQAAAYLAQEATQLDQTVNWYPTIHPHVRGTVRNFAHATSELTRCHQGNYGGADPGLYGPCGQYIQQVLNQVGYLDQSLDQTRYQFPAVHQQYVRTRDAAQQLQQSVGQPGFPGNPGHPGHPGNPGHPGYPGHPHPGIARAFGNMDSYQFSFIGNRFQIRQNCMNFAYQRGLQFVREFVVNGQIFRRPYGQLTPASQACDLVAQNAR